MRKHWFVFGMAVALLAACSSEDELAQEQTLDIENLDINALDSDVPIVFGHIGGEAGVTRGSIDADAFEADNVGIFMLSRKNLTSSLGTNWANNSTNAVYNKLRIWQNNTKAKIVRVTGSGVEYSKITWNDDKEEHFYPSVQTFLYDFVSYAPRTDSIEYDTNSVYAVIDLDGSQDVIHSHAEAPSVSPELAYSSNYFKDVAGAEYPHFNYEHKLAALKFKVRLKGDYASVGTYVIDSIYLENVPSRVRLFVAHRGGPNAALDGATGNIYSIDATDQRRNFYLLENDDTSIADGNYELTSEFQPVGDAIMIPPFAKTNANSTLKLRIVIRDLEDNSRYSPSNAITLAAPEGGWQSGKSYNIKVTLTDPVKVVAKARLDDYVEGEEYDVSDE